MNCAMLNNFFSIGSVEYSLILSLSIIRIGGMEGRFEFMTKLGGFVSAWNMFFAWIFARSLPAFEYISVKLDGRGKCANRWNRSISPASSTIVTWQLKLYAKLARNVGVRSPRRTA